MPEAEIDRMARRQHDRLAGHATIKLEECDDRTGESERTDGAAEPHLEQGDPGNAARRAEIEGLRRIERGRRDQNRRHADERVEGGDELRHRRHGHAPGDRRADAATNGDPGDDQQPASEGGIGIDQRRGHGQTHADHAVDIALARGCWMGQAAQRQNEQDARDEVKQVCDIGAHPVSPSSCTWRACAG